MTSEQLTILKGKFGDRLEEQVPFKTLTTVTIGGPAQALYRAQTVEEFFDALVFADQNQIPYFVLGGGSNLLVSDEGLDSLVIKNEVTGISQSGDTIIVQAGTVLQDLVDFTINQNFEGMHKMTGIPGTVGGAVYGNAGAYGQTISDYLVSILCFDGKEHIRLNKEACGFSYRESDFKHNGLIVLELTFELPPGDSAELAKESADTLTLRQAKYKPGIKCPGSLFKNVLTETLSEEVKAKLPEYKDTYGKIPAWLFLDEVGAKDARRGAVHIADFHGNLFLNEGDATAADFYGLAKEYYDKVKQKFGFSLEPEVQFINLPPFD